jgi:WD40 repeat protein
MAFSPDGKRLASASHGNVVRVWDTETEALIQTMRGHSGVINTLKFSPDGKKLATASDDMTVRIWNGVTALSLHVIYTKNLVSNLAFSVDGSHLQTNIGRLNFGSTQDIPSHSSVLTPELRLHGDWLIRKGERVICLPLTHSALPSMVAVHGTIMAFGRPSGDVSFWEIDT